MTRQARLGGRGDKAAEWVYRGVWAALARWFKVPSSPPSLPVRDGERTQSFRPSTNFVKYLKLWFWLSLTAVDAGFLIAWLASFVVSPWLGIALLPVFLAVAVFPDILAYLAIHLRYDTTWYVLTDRSLRIRRGIWTIRETTITFENVQNVSVRQGPVQKHYGIADVIVQTAGGGGATGGHKKGGQSDSHKGLIEGVEDAGQIRDLIMAKVRHSRAAGLGDEEHLLPSGPGAAGAHLSVLREIRDSIVLLGTSIRKYEDARSGD